MGTLTSQATVIGGARCPATASPEPSLRHGPRGHAGTLGHRADLGAFQDRGRGRRDLAGAGLPAPGNPARMPEAVGGLGAGPCGNRWVTISTL